MATCATVVAAADASKLVIMMKGDGTRRLESQKMDGYLKFSAKRVSGNAGRRLGKIPAFGFVTLVTVARVLPFFASYMSFLISSVSKRTIRSFLSSDFTSRCKQIHKMSTPTAGAAGKPVFFFDIDNCVSESAL